MTRPVSERVAAVCEVMVASAQSDYIGEAINQLEHGLQCAHFATQTGASDEAVLAALLHDIGHLIDAEAPTMQGLGTIDHEGLGADYLRDHGFSETVARLVEGHVQAKRYLTFAKPAYAARLSDASRGTLEWQGGPMCAEEAESFEADPLFAQLLAVRTWDERAKVVDLDVADLAAYRTMMQTHLEQQDTSRGS